MCVCVLCWVVIAQKRNVGGVRLYFIARFYSEQQKAASSPLDFCRSGAEEAADILGADAASRKSTKFFFFFFFS